MLSRREVGELVDCMQELIGADYPERVDDNIEASMGQAQSNRVQEIGKEP